MERTLLGDLGGAETARRFLCGPCTGVCGTVCLAVGDPGREFPPDSKFWTGKGMGRAAEGEEGRLAAGDSALGESMGGRLRLASEGIGTAEVTTGCKEGTGLGLLRTILICRLGGADSKGSGVGTGLNDGSSLELSVSKESSKRELRSLMGLWERREDVGDVPGERV